MKEKVIDVSGEICPYPEMKTAEALEEAKKENVEELVIITDHPPAGLLTIPQRLEQGGYKENEHFIVKKEGSTWTFRVKIEEGKNVST
ncbi:MAG: sulfurtransferase TusA family protein [Candidatus Ranarchaeia archaeon]